MSKSKKNSMAREEVRRTMRVLDMDKDKQHVVLIKQGSGMSNLDSVRQFAEAMAHSGVNGVVCVVDDFAELTILDEEAMAQNGWYFTPMTIHQKGNPEEQVEALPSP